MDDMFGMLYSDLDPSKKLLTAVTSNMIDSLDSLANSGSVDLDATLHHNNGNRALHVAAMSGHDGCVRMLLHYGVDPDATNAFGFTALSLALRSGRAGTARVLLEHGSVLCGEVALIWRSQNMDESHTWLAYNTDCLKLLINATSDFSRYDDADTNAKQRAEVFGREPELMQMYLLCGNKFDALIQQRVVERYAVKMRHWIKQFGKCRSLQHCARSVIRRHLRHNVFFASRNLPIPVKIQEYMLITDVSNPDV